MSDEINYCFVAVASPIEVSLAALLGWDPPSSSFRVKTRHETLGGPQFHKVVTSWRQIGLKYYYKRGESVIETLHSDDFWEWKGSVKIYVIEY